MDSAEGGQTDNNTLVQTDRDTMHLKNVQLIFTYKAFSEMPLWQSECQHFLHHRNVVFSIIYVCSHIDLSYWWITYKGNKTHQSSGKNLAIKLRISFLSLMHAYIYAHTHWICGLLPSTDRHTWSSALLNVSFSSLYSMLHNKLSSCNHNGQRTGQAWRAPGIYLIVPQLVTHFSFLFLFHVYSFSATAG